MKKITILSILFAMAFTSFALAQDKIDVKAQIRVRTQVLNTDFNSNTAFNSFTELRSRLGVKFTQSEKLHGFIQLQDSRIYGREGNTLTDIQNVDIHQAFFCIKNIFNLPFSVKAGRMELSYGSQRLLGAVGWHNVGRSFDGAILKLATDAIDVDFIGARTGERFLPGDSLDSFLFSAYGNIKAISRLNLQPFVIVDGMNNVDFTRATLGIHASCKNKKKPFQHDLDAAYQLGTKHKNVDIAAFMVALNLAYTFDAKVKPTLGAGVAYLSGNDGKDASKYKVFNTLYATNHKFYGYMDYFLNIPNQTYGLGLMDIHGKVSVSPCQKSKISLAYHMFNSSEKATLIGGKTSNSFGSEIDLTLVHKYSDGVKFVGGFSTFMPGDIFKERKGKDTSFGGYFMAIVNFN